MTTDLNGLPSPRIVTKAIPIFLRFLRLVSLGLRFRVALSKSSNTPENSSHRIPFEDHRIKLDRYNEDKNGRCATMTCANREVYQDFCASGALVAWRPWRGVSLSSFLLHGKALQLAQTRACFRSTFQRQRKCAVISVQDAHEEQLC